MSVLDLIGHLVQKHIVKKRPPPLPSMKKTFVIALGNPGKQYKNTRHNYGQMAVDYLVTLLQTNSTCSDWKEHNKAPVRIAELQDENQKIYFVKPLSYMNDSGKPVRALLDFYKATADDVIIIHDELDLDLGEIRITPEASAGGHNGLKSIFNHLGTKKIRRLRLGIKNNKLNKIPTNKFVLQPFGILEKIKVKNSLNRLGEVITCMIFEDVESCMNKFN